MWEIWRKLMEVALVCSKWRRLIRSMGSTVMSVRVNMFDLFPFRPRGVLEKGQCWWCGLKWLLICCTDSTRLSWKRPIHVRRLLLWFANYAVQFHAVGLRSNTTIRLRFDCSSTAVWLSIDHNLIVNDCSTTYVTTCVWAASLRPN